MNSKPFFDESQFREDVGLYLATMQTLAQRVADQMRLGGGDSAMGVLIELIDGCQLVVECLIRFAEIHLEYASADEKVHWTEAETRLQSVIAGSVAAFEKRDFVLVADLVEYELIQVLNLWSEVIRSGMPVKDLNGSEQDNHIGSGES